MDHSPPPPHQLDPALQLQRDIDCEAAETLRAMLPPPLTDTPEAWTRRNRVAMARVAALVPASCVEADLAALAVAAAAHAKDCLRQASECEDDRKESGKLRAQAASMGREARGYLGKLDRMQVVRLKREATDDTRDSAAMTEHCVFGLMSDAMESLPPLVRPARPAAPAAAPAGRAAAAAQPPAQVRLRDYEEWTDEEKREDRLRAKAGRYAILNTARVRLIRQLGRLPDNCDFEPPEPEVLHEIIHGDSSNLRWADTWEPYVPK